MKSRMSFFELTSMTRHSLSDLSDDVIWNSTASFAAARPTCIKIIKITKNKMRRRGRGEREKGEGGGVEI